MCCLAWMKNPDVWNSLPKTKVLDLVPVSGLEQRRDGNKTSAQEIHSSGTLSLPQVTRWWGKTEVSWLHRELSADQITPKKAVFIPTYPSCLDSCPSASSQFWASLWLYELSRFPIYFLLFEVRLGFSCLDSRSSSCYNDYVKTQENSSNSVSWQGLGEGVMDCNPKYKVKPCTKNQNFFFLQLTLSKEEIKSPLQSQDLQLPEFTRRE